jgi:F-type H+-transporting ATPase subunit gamma
MATLRDLRKRLKAVKNTQKITKAMKMVAASKLKKAQDAILAARPYALRMQEVLQHIIAHAEDLNAHPLLAAREPKRIELVVLTSDRGLCGSFNSSITRFGERYLKENSDRFDAIRLSSIGKKGRDHFKRKGFEVFADYSGISGSPKFEQADEIAQDLAKRFEGGEVDAIYLLYNEFKSAISQKVVLKQLLPIVDLEGWEDNPRVRVGDLASFSASTRALTEAQTKLEVELPASGATASSSGSKALEIQPEGFEHVYEPTREEVLDTLLPQHLAVQLYRAVLESTAAEHGARMTAMDAASRNAKDMIERLTLRTNRARQAAITTELLEIIGGAEALKA